MLIFWALTIKKLNLEAVGATSFNKVDTLFWANFGPQYLRIEKKSRPNFFIFSFPNLDLWEKSKKVEKKGSDNVPEYPQSWVVKHKKWSPTAHCATFFQLFPLCSDTTPKGLKMP